MKKIAALTAAMLTASAAIPYIPHAAEELTIRNDAHRASSDKLEAEAKLLKKIADENLNLDFNSDGKFDNLDCYLFNRYDDYPGSKDYLPEEIRAKIAANADLDGDGTISGYENGVILRHFLYNCDIDTSYFDEEIYLAYDDELGIKHGPSYNSNKFGYNFVHRLNSQTIVGGVHYLFLQKMIEQGKVDPDVNNDGKFDMGDVVDFKIAVDGIPWVSRQDPDTGLWTISACPDKKIELDEEINKRAATITLLSGEYDYENVQEYDVSALLDCLLATEPLLPEYSDNAYYEKYREGAEYYSIGEMVEEYRKYTGIDGEKPSLEEVEQQKADAETLKEQFFKDVDSGKINIDLNFDNVLNGLDVDITFTFQGDKQLGRTADESSLTKEVYENLDTNCDFNNNGTSGDVDDIILIQDYIFSYVYEKTGAMATDSTGEFYRGYADALYQKEMSPDKNLDSSDPFHLYDDSGEKYEFPKLNYHYDNYLRHLAMKMASRPDIDGNGKVDELDKKYADSYITFLETGKQGETEIPDEVLERIKTECDYTLDNNSGNLYDMQVASLYIDKVVLKNDDTKATDEKNEDKKADDKPVTEKESAPLSANDTKPAEENTAGDANCDNELSMADSVLIMQSIANPSKFGLEGTDENHITAQGIKNADISGENDGVTTGDSLTIQKTLLGLNK